MINSHINLELMTNSVINTRQKSKIVPNDPIQLENEIIGKVPRYMTHTSAKLLRESDYSELNAFKEIKARGAEQRALMTAHTKVRYPRVKER